MEGRSLLVRCVLFEIIVTTQRMLLRNDEVNPFGDDFHLYGIEWDEQSMKFFVDDIQVGEVVPPAGGFWARWPN